MRALGAMVIFLGLIGAAIAVAVYGVFDTGKRLSRKETRPSAIADIKQGAKSTGKVASGVAVYYLLFFGGIFLFLVVVYGLGLG